MNEIVVLHDLLVIDTNLGATSASTPMKYSASRPIRMWMRYLGTPTSPGTPQPCTIIDLFKRIEARPGRTPDEIKRADFEGTFESDPVVPGQVLQYGLTENDDLDPNVSSQMGELESVVTILGVGALVEQDWLGDDFVDVGGTYYFRALDTLNYGRTMIRVRASQNPPVVDVNGLPQFAAAEHSADDVNPGWTHTFELKPLLPGHRYHLVVMLIDLDGHWTLLPERVFETKSRKVQISCPEVSVTDDGDNFDTGEAEFAVHYLESDQGLTRQVRGDQLGDDDNPVTVDTGKSYATNFPPVTIGPRPFGEQDRVWIVVGGTEYDGVTERDEHAHGERYIQFPSGRGKETVPWTDTWVSTPFFDDSFEFSVRMLHRVDYV